jgi:hypothetical protein
MSTLSANIHPLGGQGGGQFSRALRGAGLTSVVLTSWNWISVKISKANAQSWIAISKGRVSDVLKIYMTLVRIIQLERENSQLGRYIRSKMKVN